MSATTEQFKNYLHSKNFRDEFKAELSKKSVGAFLMVNGIKYLL